MRVRVVALIFLLLLPLVSAMATTPPKPGTPCGKVGATAIYSGKKFTCIKSGKKVIWNQGVLIKVPAPQPTPPAFPSPFSTPTPSPTSSTTTTPSSTPSPSPTSSPTATPPPGGKQKVSAVSYSPPSITSEDVELCKMKQLNAALDAPRSGFPSPLQQYASSGTVKWALVPLDFADLPGEVNFMNRVSDQMTLASEWAENTSGGKFKIEWVVQKSWVRLPGNSQDYAVPLMDMNDFRQPEQTNFWKKAIVEADKYVDFTGVQAVHFILPQGQKLVVNGIKGISWYQEIGDYITGEGTRIGFFTIPGTFQDASDLGRTYWSYWMYTYSTGLRVAKFGGSKIATPFHSYLIQGSTEGERELGGWHRFLIGWLSDSRVYCRQASNLTSLDITLVPLVDNANPGYKLAVIPLSDSKAIILESRRVTKFACTTYTERNGVLAYVYDARLGHTEDYFSAITPAGRKMESYSCAGSASVDPLLHEGDRVTYEGVSIELLAHGDFDRLRISRN